MLANPPSKPTRYIETFQRAYSMCHAKAQDFRVTEQAHINGHEIAAKNKQW